MPSSKELGLMEENIVKIEAKYHTTLMFCSPHYFEYSTFLKNE